MAKSSHEWQPGGFSLVAPSDEEPVPIRPRFQRGPSAIEFEELPAKPTIIPSMFVLFGFTVAYVMCQQKELIETPSSPSMLKKWPWAVSLTLLGVINMYNHVAGYLQPVPMWSLFTGAFIDFVSSASYMGVFYVIGYTPIWMMCCWVFQMAIHSYYMSTGLASGDRRAESFASLMRHMRRLQMNEKKWWNTAFLYFDMCFHAIFLREVVIYNTAPMLCAELMLGFGVYYFLYARAANVSDEGRPKLYVKDGLLVCPCLICKGGGSFMPGCTQWFASIDQLYLDCWGVCSVEDHVLKRATSTLMDRSPDAGEVVGDDDVNLLGGRALAHNIIF